jgi:hypothetical protein
MSGPLVFCRRHSPNSQPLKDVWNNRNGGVVEACMVNIGITSYQDVRIVKPIGHPWLSANHQRHRWECDNLKKESKLAIWLGTTSGRAAATILPEGTVLPHAPGCMEETVTSTKLENLAKCEYGTTYMTLNNCRTILSAREGIYLLQILTFCSHSFLFALKKLLRFHT